MSPRGLRRVGVFSRVCFFSQFAVAVLSSVAVRRSCRGGVAAARNRGRKSGNAKVFFQISLTQIVGVNEVRRKAAAPQSRGPSLSDSFSLRLAIRGI